VTSFILIKYLSTTGECKVAFSLQPSTAVACLQSNVCERGGRSKNLVWKVCYVRPSTAVTHTDLTRDDRKARVTATVRMLLNQADPRSRAKVSGYTVGMERAAKCKRVLVT